MYCKFEKLNSYKKKIADFLGRASKLANFVWQWVRHIIWPQNEQIKKVGYIYGLGPRDQKVQKTLKFHVFPPFCPPRGGKTGQSPQNGHWSSSYSQCERIKP